MEENHIRVQMVIIMGLILVSLVQAKDAPPSPSLPSNFLPPSSSVDGVQVLHLLHPKYSICFFRATTMFCFLERDREFLELGRCLRRFIPYCAQYPNVFPLTEILVYKNRGPSSTLWQALQSLDF